MNTKNIVVSGNIISELSDKIPNISIALNELIKNSYDSGSESVDVVLNKELKTLVVRDYGSGLDENGIERLLHLSKSEKVYGKINEHHRITQGSKGLGFLSVFKFGSYVTWETVQDGTLNVFSIDFHKISLEEDVTKYDIDIKSSDTDLKNGTLIRISLNDESYKLLVKYLEDQVNLQKVLYSMDDDSFLINVVINGNTFSNKEQIKLIDIVPERQVFKITYNSSEQEIHLFYNNIKIDSKDYRFESNRFAVQVELMVYDFSSQTLKKFIPNLFYNNREEITPLIYINDNLFYNYDLFDPNINRKKRSSQMIPQMIGYVRIICDDSDLTFNSDRTRFNENFLTISIANFLEKFNSEMQSWAASKKPFLVDFSFLKKTSFDLPLKSYTMEDLYDNIRDGFAYKDKVDVKLDNNRVVYSFAGKEKVCVFPLENSEQKRYPVSIEPKNKIIELKIPTSQMQLLDLINSATDSSGNDIKQYLKIYVDDVEVSNGILNSIKEVAHKVIRFEYQDKYTGLGTSQVILKTYQQSSNLIGSKIKQDFISFPSSITYKFTLSSVITNLYKQINTLGDDIDKWIELVSAGIRTTFDVCMSEILRCGKLKSSGINVNKNLTNNIEALITYINKTQGAKKEISNRTGIKEDSLKTLLTVHKFKEAIYDANLGTHTSSQLISIKELENIAKKLGLFIVITNEVINNRFFM